MLNKLVRGNKYTLVGNDGMLNFNMKITLVDFIYKQYAQYEDVPVITFKKKGGRKLYTMYLTYQYSFLEGWKDIETKKLVKDTTQMTTYILLKYNELDLSNAVVSGTVGKIQINKNYESLIDHSFNLGIKYGMNTENYKLKLKEIFTELNYSLSTEMIDYYKKYHDYFLKTLVNNLQLR